MQTNKNAHYILLTAYFIDRLVTCRGCNPLLALWELFLLKRPMTMDMWLGK